MKFLVILFLASVAVFSVVESKVFKKCDLARTLVSKGISRADLPNWICLIQSESGFNTRATNKNTNKSTDYGLFQINDGFWCKKGSPGKDCNIKCESLIDDDITDDVKCAKIIFKRHGYNAWYGWKNKCKGKALPSVSECFPRG